MENDQRTQDRTAAELESLWTSFPFQENFVVLCLYCSFSAFGVVCIRDNSVRAGRPSTVLFRRDHPRQVRYRRDQLSTVGTKTAILRYSVKS